MKPKMILTAVLAILLICTAIAIPVLRKESGKSEQEYSDRISLLTKQIAELKTQIAASNTDSTEPTGQTQPEQQVSSDYTYDELESMLSQLEVKIAEQEADYAALIEEYSYYIDIWNNLSSGKDRVEGYLTDAD